MVESNPDSPDTLDTTAHSDQTGSPSARSAMPYARAAQADCQGQGAIPAGNAPYATLFAANPAVGLIYGRH